MVCGGGYFGVSVVSDSISRVEGTARLFQLGARTGELEEDGALRALGDCGEEHGVGLGRWLRRPGHAHTAGEHASRLDERHVDTLDLALAALGLGLGSVGLGKLSDPASHVGLDGAPLIGAKVEHAQLCEWRALEAVLGDAHGALGGAPQEGIWRTPGQPTSLRRLCRRCRCGRRRGQGCVRVDGRWLFQRTGGGRCGGVLLGSRLLLTGD